MGYGMWIAVGIAAVLGGAALSLAVRYRMLQNCLRQAGLDMKEILENPAENRILLSACPSAEAERLFIQINRYIQHCQQERIIWQRQERQLQEQIENISHDLRTPLTSILGYLELVDGSVLTAEDQEALAVVEKKSRYLQKLIGDFYDLVRLERAGQAYVSGQTAGNGEAFSLKLEPLEVTRLVREAVLSYYLEFEKRNLKVDLELPETAVMIMGDRGALERILHNLIQNALRYARSRFRIRIDVAEAPEPRVCMDFCNDTEGLLQEDIEHLFDRFYTADHARRDGSTGLGLTVSRLLAEAMGGEAFAELDREDSRQEKDLQQDEALQDNGELHLFFCFRRI